jgi:hypothetical protein
VLDAAKQGLGKLANYGLDKAKRSNLATSARNISQAVSQRSRSGGDIGDEYAIRQQGSRVLKFWKNYTQKFANSIRDPQQREQYLTGQSDLYRRQLIQFVETNLLGRTPIGNFENGDQIMEIINELSGFPAAGSQPTQQSQPSQRPAQTTQQPVQQPVQPKRPTPMVTPRGVKVTSGEPRILNFKNTDFVRNETGEWATLKGNRPASPPLQAFLDKEDDYLDTLTEGFAGPENEELELFNDLIRMTSVATTKTDDDSERRTGKKKKSIKQQVTPGTVVNSTGNDEADRALAKMGYKVQ